MNPLISESYRLEQVALHAKGNYGTTGQAYGSFLSSLAKQLEAQDGYVAARPLFERALQIREQVLGPIHPDTQKVRGTLHSMEQRAASSEANPDDSPDKE